MAAMIKAAHATATVARTRWTCGDAGLLALLDAWRSDDLSTAGDPDIVLAHAAVQRLRRMNIAAEVIAQDEPEGEEGAVY